jgi:GxxExxY protein
MKPTTPVTHDLTHKIIGSAMRVHSRLGFGFLESVYRNALLHELHKNCLQAQSEQAIQVYYDGVLVGDFKADIIVEGTIILELKAVENLQKIHEVQLVNYLNATGTEVGLLLNFGAASLEFKKKFRRPKDQTGLTGLTGYLLIWLLQLLGRIS